LNKLIFYHINFLKKKVLQQVFNWFSDLASYLNSPVSRLKGDIGKANTSL